MSTINVKVEIYKSNRPKFITLCKTVGQIDLEQGDMSILKKEFNMDQFRKQTDFSENTIRKAWITEGEAQACNQKAYKLLGIYKGQNLSENDNTYYDMNIFRNILKGYYHDNMEMIQKFGYKVTKGKHSPNVKLPGKSVNVLLPAVKKTIRMHEELGDQSPLNASKMTTFKSRVEEADKLIEQARVYNDDAQPIFDEALKAMGVYNKQTVNTKGTLYYTLARIRDFLLYKFQGEEEELECWGFRVVINRSKTHHEKEVEIIENS